MSHGPERAVHKVDCGIIVVTYNSARHIESLLNSLSAAAEGLSTRCVVVDNNSSDDTVAIVRARGDAEPIVAGGNLGYSGGINLGRSTIGPCSSLAILNPDLRLEPGALSRLYQALGEEGVGVTVPRISNADGTLFTSLRREPTLLNSLGEALFGAHWPTRPRCLSDTERGEAAYRVLHDADWASGAALLISSACNDAVGDWDDGRFFLYSEETDFAARARRGGFQVRYVPAASARHEAGGSGRSPALDALMAVNRIRYYEKYHGRRASGIFRAIVALHHFLRSADPDERMILKTVLRRSSWTKLPKGDRLVSGFAVTR